MILDSCENKDGIFRILHCALGSRGKLAIKLPHVKRSGSMVDPKPLASEYISYTFKNP